MMGNFLNQWQTYAFGAAVFAALTTIFGKIGVAKSVSVPYAKIGYTGCGQRV
jgi:uncharacterized membrane protein